jgi:hypothetical protein
MTIATKPPKVCSKAYRILAEEATRKQHPFFVVAKGTDIYVSYDCKIWTNLDLPAEIERELDWTCVGCLPQSIVLVGGKSETREARAGPTLCWMYNVSLNLWTQLPNGPPKRKNYIYSQILYHNNVLYVLGVGKLDLSTSVWERGIDDPHGGFSPEAFAVVDDRILAKQGDFLYEYSDGAWVERGDTPFFCCRCLLCCLCFCPLLCLGIKDTCIGSHSIQAMVSFRGKLYILIGHMCLKPYFCRYNPRTNS